MLISVFSPLVTSRYVSTDPLQYIVFVFQLCGFHLAYAARDMFAVGVLSEEEAMATVTVLADLATKSPHVSMINAENPILNGSKVLCLAGAIMAAECGCGPAWTEHVRAWSGSFPC